MDWPLVSVVIPALNEGDDIAGCIDAIGAQDYPLESIEVIVADGDSEDATIEAARSAAAAHPFKSFSSVSNPRRRTSCGLNAGLAEARGEIVVRVDARSRIESHYVSTCVELLRQRPEVGEVGGAQIATPRSDHPIDVGLARAQRNRLASGFSRYRRSTISGPAEHVWMGAFRTRELRAIGGWDDATALNEDFELSQRYLASGQIVFFDARLQSGYLARTTFPALARQHFYFGRVKGTWWARGRRPLGRHVALLAVPPTAVLAGVAMMRRFGVVPTVVIGAGCAMGIEALGCPGPTGGLRARLVATAGIATYGTTWWVGTFAGFAGEKAGVQHRHG